MSQEDSRKPGFWDRLLGREAEPPRPEPDPRPTSPGARPDDSPDFATAAFELPPQAAPTATTASPDVAPDDMLAPELAGADLQPIEGFGAEDAVPRRLGWTAAPEAEATPRNWWRRLSEGMRRTSSSLGQNVTGLFTKRKLDPAMLEELEDLLVRADLGLATAARIAAAVGEGRYDKEIAPDEVRAILAAEIEKTLAPVARPLVVDRTRKPFVVLVIGVNGAGKTTTIGKLAQKFRTQRLTVMMAAGDTFRAAAIEQLKVWGERTGAPVMSRPQGSDAAGVAFDALRDAKAAGSDVLLIDTAGRLQNKTELMAELEKIVRVMKKLDPEAPHAVLLVLDATVGQNALSQVELFSQSAGLTGLVMTKLDGTARGGILVALAQKFGLPIHYIGVGEGVEDLEPFAARDFARAITGLER